MRKIIYSVVVGLVVLFSGCESWLDVQPRTKIKSDDLFETEAGFKDALTGIYTLMKSESLYGREMTFGFVEVVTNGYAYSSSYTNVANWNYTEVGVRPLVNNMWGKMYNALANVNNLLDNIDSHKDVFTENNYNIIKGEALGLRAYLHFDLLRLFASATDLDQEAIPYVKTLQIEVPTVYTGREVLSFISEDIHQALQCLEKDPIREGILNDPDNDDFLNNRQMHFNYFAVKALQARAALWGGDKETAKAAAGDVLDVAEIIFPWVTLEAASSTDESQRDYTYSTEHIFALNVRNLKDLVDYWFMPDNNTLLYAQKSSIEQRYEVGQGNNVGGVDYRKLYQMKDEKTGGDYKLYKYYQPDKYLDEYAERIPLIRLSEMYYIMAECLMGEDDVQALEYLNEVRRHRGIASDLTDTNLLRDELTKEYAKEFFMEGQIFYYCKRLNLAKFPCYYKALTDGVYVLPIPDTELEFGDYYKVEK